MAAEDNPADDRYETDLCIEEIKRLKQELAAAPKWETAPTCPGLWLGARLIRDDMPKTLSGSVWHIHDPRQFLPGMSDVKFWFGPLVHPLETGDTPA